MYRRKKVNVIHGGSDYIAAGMTVRGHCSGNVDEMLKQFDVVMVPHHHMLVFQLTPKKPTQSFRTIGLAFRDEKLMTMPQLVTLFSVGGRADNQLGVKIAAAVVLALPVMIAFLFFQKHFIQSMASTGLKD